MQKIDLLKQTAAYNFLKCKLDARFILEQYEKTKIFFDPTMQRNQTRAEMWAFHLSDPQSEHLLFWIG